MQKEVAKDIKGVLNPLSGTINCLNFTKNGVIRLAKKKPKK